MLVWSARVTSEASLEIPKLSCKDCCCIRGALCTVQCFSDGTHTCVHVKVCQFGECLVKWYTKTKKNPGHPPLSGRLFLQKGAKKKRSNIFAVREMLPKKMY